MCRLVDRADARAVGGGQADCLAALTAVGLVQFGLGDLRPTHPETIDVAQETLDFRREGFSPSFFATYTCILTCGSSSRPHAELLAPALCGSRRSWITPCSTLDVPCRPRIAPHSVSPALH